MVVDLRSNACGQTVLDGADVTPQCLAAGAASDALRCACTWCVRACSHACVHARPGNARAW